MPPSFIGRCKIGADYIFSFACLEHTCGIIVDDSRWYKYRKRGKNSGGMEEECKYGGV
jgi:hypothetical protein